MSNILFRFRISLLDFRHVTKFRVPPGSLFFSSNRGDSPRRMGAALAEGARTAAPPRTLPPATEARSACTAPPDRPPSAMEAEGPSQATVTEGRTPDWAWIAETGRINQTLIDGAGHTTRGLLQASNSLLRASRTCCRGEV
eukprot:420615-Prorocentrum_minimum.AAC.1